MAGISPSRLSGRSIARRDVSRGDAFVRRSRPLVPRRSEAEIARDGGGRCVVAVVADMEAVVIVTGRRGRLVRLVMGMAGMFVRMAGMAARDRGDLRQPGRIGDRRTQTQHRQRKQADQGGSDGRESGRYHPERYKREGKAK